tara:strand:- start:12803 stop:13138 length:336 start_codon:yes stop_codon:yes gene_type:complete
MSIYKMAKSPRKKSPMRKRGSRAQVMNGSALKTPGGLRKKDLKYNKNGRIVSKKRSARAKRENRLVKSGYVTEKGVFGSKFVGEKKRSSKKRSKKRSSKKRSSGSRNSSWF